MLKLDVTDTHLLGANTASLSLNSLSPSTLSMSIRVNGLLDPCPYQRGEHYQIIYKGKTIIVGICTKARPVIQGGTKRQASKTYEIVISDYFHLLDQSTYLAGGGRAGMIQTSNGVYYTNNQFSTVPIGRVVKAKNASIPSTSEDARAKISDSFEQICSVASACVIPFSRSIEISDSAELVPFVVSASTYLSLLCDIQVFRPNAVMFWDYSEYDNPLILSPLPILRFADQSSMQDYNIDIANGLVSELSIEPRPDLVPPAVAFVQTTKSDTGASIKVINSYPPGVDLSRPGCVILEYSGTAAYSVPTEPKEGETEEEADERDEEERRRQASLSLSLHKVRIKGSPLPRDQNLSKSFWERHNPRFKEFTNLRFGKLNIVADPSSEGDPAAIDYELVEGSPPQTNGEIRGLAWGDAIVEQYIGHPDPVPVKARDMFTKKHPDGTWYDLFQISVRTINKIGGTYIVGGDGTFYPGDPPDEEEEEDDDDSEGGFGQPHSSDDGRLLEAARSYWMAAQPVPYEGHLSYLDIISDPLLGNAVNLTGGEPSWSNMRALVQNHEIDLFNRTTRIQFGPPTHRVMTDFASRTKEAVQIEDKTKTEESASSNSSDPETTNFSWGNKNKKRPQVPGITPRAQLVQSRKTDVTETYFEVRPLWNDENSEIVGAEVLHGEVMCVETGLKKETGSGWRRIEQTGAIYCNVNLDRYGRILTAIISTSMGGYRAWKWPDFTKEAVDQDKDLEVAQYSFEIAEVLSDKIIQKRTGVIHFNWRPPVTVIMSEFP